jgi:hypothetical protein
MIKNQPNGLDFMKALDILIPYREELIKIHEDYKTEKSIKEKSDDQPDLRNENIRFLGKELLQKIHHLTTKSEFDITYEHIQMKHGIPPYRFDWHWELQEVYIYLIHVFNTNNDKMIINSILNGELIDIIECFFIRI